MWLQTKVKFFGFFTKDFSAEHFINTWWVGTEILVVLKKIKKSFTDMLQNHCYVAVLTFSIENSNKWSELLQLLNKNFASFTQLFTVEMKGEKKI